MHHRPAIKQTRIFLTAAEAYPALEQAFLSAKTEISASFLVFNLKAPLRSVAARLIGKTWFDLIVHTLKRGVALSIVISDVDPIARSKMHLHATRNYRMFLAAGEVAGPKARLSVRCARHPAKSGVAVRLAIWPIVMKTLSKTAGWLNTLPDAQRAAALRDMPGVKGHFHQRADGTIRPSLSALPQVYPATHHQKIAVFDRRLLYIGGLDVDDRFYDTPQHRQSADQTWHDVQLMLTGQVAVEAQAHLDSFRAVASGATALPFTQTLLRTVSQARKRNLWHFGPKNAVAELRDAHFALIRRSDTLIYMESQYFRDRKMARLLAARARGNPQLGLILILPAAPDEVAFDGKSGLDSRYGEAMQASCLRILRHAFNDRLFVGSPAQPRQLPRTDPAQGSQRDRLCGAPIIYVHAKVSIFDDRAAIVSSANLNGRSMNWDTEAGVHLSAPHDVTELRNRLMTHWLPDRSGPDAFAPQTAVAVWARLAQENASRQPKDRKGFLLPHDFAAAEAFGTQLPIVPEEIV